MPGPVVPGPADAECVSNEAYRRFVKTAVYFGTQSQGHHNRNHVVRPFTDSMAQLVARDVGRYVTVRLPLHEALPVVVRTWPDESEILRSITGILPHVPECLAKQSDSAIHSYVEGVPLSSVCQNGKPVDALLIDALAGLLAQMGRVRKDALPPLPADWPRDGRGGRAFLTQLARLTERQVRQPNVTAFGGLFAALGIPEDAMSRFADRLPAMARRPYALLHTDLHRDNVIVSYHGSPPLICVDWELASYGDPLHDLATHLVRMQYPDFQWNEVIEAWAAAMDAGGRPQAVNGLDRDLWHYVDFERAQSVFPDVMRAANSLGATFDQKDLDQATRAVADALTAAEGPLHLFALPGLAEIERALVRWRMARGGRYSGDPDFPVSWEPVRDKDWERDARVREAPEFPDAAVREALLAEGAAPADRMFKGTSHLNTVVTVSGNEHPVVVRRMVGSVRRLEGSFLSEHAVLQAIAALKTEGMRVRAPKVLALGVSNRKDPFVIHSYEGPTGSLRPPSHPVHGLLPHEADDLVDQLCALTAVNYSSLDPFAGVERIDFFRWLSEELARLVDKLPKASKQLARELGLPGSRRLAEILGRYRVVRRTPALLHGDLNPWNLVRREDGDGGITIIDWEMAMVGDPLYDLVRHMHLTPTRSDIRRRMFERWSRKLPDDYTKGWEEDWRVYRWVEIVRSAYVDLDRLVTGASLDAPSVQRAVHSYAMTLKEATAALGLSRRSTVNPYLARALPHGDPVGAKGDALRTDADTDRAVGDPARGVAAWWLRETARPRGTQAGV